MSETYAIEAEGLVKVFGRTRALDGIDLQVRAGTILGMLGPNGAGKTTTVRVLTTLLRADLGTARVAGFDVRTEAAQVRREIGLTGQYAALDESLTGRANLIMVGQLCRMSKKQAKQRAAELLDEFDLTVAAGEIFGLLGPNGAGKTTTLRILTTLLPADAGSARVAGADSGALESMARVRLSPEACGKCSFSSACPGSLPLKLSCAGAPNLVHRVMRQATPASQTMRVTQRCR